MRAFLSLASGCSMIAALAACATTSPGPASGGAAATPGPAPTSTTTPGASEPPLSLLEPATPAELRALLAASGPTATIVNVWATWCEPCVAEFPDVLRAAREARPRGVRMMFVSADFESEHGAAEKFLRQSGVDFTTYVKKGDDQAFIDGLNPSWSGSLPATMIFDGRGNLRFFREGDIDYAALTAAIDVVLD